MIEISKDALENRQLITYDFNNQYRSDYHSTASLIFATMIQKIEGKQLRDLGRIVGGSEGEVIFDKKLKKWKHITYSGEKILVSRKLSDLIEYEDSDKDGKIDRFTAYYDRTANGIDFIDGRNLLKKYESKYKIKLLDINDKTLKKYRNSYNSNGFRTKR